MLKKRLHVTPFPNDVYRRGHMDAPEHELREARHLPGWLWSRLRADPVRAPEHVALAAAQLHGPAAAQWLAERRRLYAHSPREMAEMARKRHVNFARVSGAATGIGGFTTIVADLAALAWIQSRMVFFIAAALGRDPTDPMRPAELLVIQGVYPDPEAARRALDGLDTTVVEAYARSRLGRQEELASRLWRLVGRHATERLAGKAIPGLAIAVNAIGNARDTKALGSRAIAYYEDPSHA